jgi:hypothetical protein
LQDTEKKQKIIKNFRISGCQKSHHKTEMKTDAKQFFFFRFRFPNTRRFQAHTLLSHQLWSGKKKKMDLGRGID